MFNYFIVSRVAKIVINGDNDGKEMNQTVCDNVQHDCLFLMIVLAELLG